jgi:hypothetical protein
MSRRTRDENPVSTEGCSPSTTPPDQDYKQLLAAVLHKGVDSVFARHVSVLASGFPSLDDWTVSRFAEVITLLNTAFVLLDRVVDRETLPGFLPQASDPLAFGCTSGVVALSRAYGSASGLFAADSAFWPRLAGLVSQWAEALYEERLYVTQEKLLADLSLGDAIRLAEAKGAPAEITPLGLGALAGDVLSAERLALSVRALNVTAQILDDIKDWRRDHLSGQPSLLLARAAAEMGRDGPFAPGDATAIARVVYFGGVLRSVLEVGKEWADKAAAAADGMQVGAWQLLIAEARRSCDQQLAVLAGYEPRPGAAKSCENLTVRFSVSSRSWEQLAFRLLRGLLRLWRDTPYLINHNGRVISLASEAREEQCGDVFTRALVASTFLAADECLDGQLGPVIAEEQDHLLSRRRPELGLWSYFPDLREEPPDADDLAEVVRVLVARPGNRELVATLRHSIDTVFAHCRNDDGSVATWLIDPDDASPTAVAQRNWVTMNVSPGPHVEVVANFLHSAHIFDKHRWFADILAGRHWVQQQQWEDGRWACEWYESDLWSQWVCTRVLADAPLRPAVRKSVQYVLTRQLSGGGWALTDVEPAGDPLSTSLALLVLAEARLAGCEVAPSRVRAGLKRLASWLAADDLLPAVPCIRMTGRSLVADGIGSDAHGSNALTTALACRAVFRWRDFE